MMQARVLVVAMCTGLAACGGSVAADEQTAGKERTMDGNHAAAAALPVLINGRALTEAEIRDVGQRYGVKPLPGNYWYDTKSGLYGVMGHQAFGFMRPGHDFGALPAGASGGNTNIFVNGRHLPFAEWVIWSTLIGAYIQPGRYWFDGNGNAGYEGSAAVLVNLYVAAQMNASAASGAGGDNIWNTRFSAGNYDSGGTRGYVSVPGYGPVGYGF